MPKGYWVGNSEVHDMDAIWKYRAANREVMTRYGAKFIVMHGQHIIVEDTYRPTQTLVEFPSYKSRLFSMKFLTSVEKAFIIFRHNYQHKRNIVR